MAIMINNVIHQDNIYIDDTIYHVYIILAKLHTDVGIISFDLIENECNLAKMKLAQKAAYMRHHWFK